MITARVVFKKDQLKKIAAAAPNKADEAVRAIAEEGMNYVKLSFGTSPADPGSPPGVDTGALRASMNVAPVKKLAYEIRDGVEYGVYLELGSTRHGYVWPFMGPMAQWLEGEIPGLLEDFLI